MATGNRARGLSRSLQVDSSSASAGVGGTGPVVPPTPVFGRGSSFQRIFVAALDGAKQPTTTPTRSAVVKVASFHASRAEATELMHNYMQEQWQEDEDARRPKDRGLAATGPRHSQKHHFGRFDPLGNSQAQQSKRRSLWERRKAQQGLQLFNAVTGMATPDASSVPETSVAVAAAEIASGGGRDAVGSAAAAFIDGGATAVAASAPADGQGDAFSFGGLGEVIDISDTDILDDDDDEPRAPTPKPAGQAAEMLRASSAASASRFPTGNPAIGADFSVDMETGAPRTNSAAHIPLAAPNLDPTTMSIDMNTGLVNMPSRPAGRTRRNESFAGTRTEELGPPRSSFRRGREDDSVPPARRVHRAASAPSSEMHGAEDADSILLDVQVGYQDKPLSPLVITVPNHVFDARGNAAAVNTVVNHVTSCLRLPPMPITVFVTKQGTNQFAKFESVDQLYHNAVIRVWPGK